MTARRSAERLAEIRLDHARDSDIVDMFDHIEALETEVLEAKQEVHDLHMVEAEASRLRAENARLRDNNEYLDNYESLIAQWSPTLHKRARAALRGEEDGGRAAGGGGRGAISGIAHQGEAVRETTRCIRCGKPAEMYGGHVLRRRRGKRPEALLAGWCRRCLRARGFHAWWTRSMGARGR